LIHSWTCLPSSRMRSSRAEASPATVARRSRTCRCSSASLDSSSCTWSSCVSMPMPLVGEVGVRLAPSFGARLAPGLGVRLRRQPPFRLHCPRARRQQPRSNRVLGRSFRCWSHQSSRTSSPRRRGTAGTSQGLVHRRSPTRHTRARSWAATRWPSRDTTHRWWWQHHVGVGGRSVVVVALRIP
jgi:hypothetical protein